MDAIFSILMIFIKFNVVLLKLGTFLYGLIVTAFIIFSQHF